YHQAEVLLLPDDSLKADNVRYATVLVREPRRVLVLCDDIPAVQVLQSAIKNQGMYRCDVKAVGTPDVINLTPAELATYQAVCLVDVRAPTPLLWETLDKYVRQGGGLAVAPGGGEVDKDHYGAEGSAAGRLLPGTLEQFEASRDGVGLVDYQ